MRRLLFLLTLTLCVSITFGQTASNADLAQKATDKMVTKYQLEGDQVAKMQKIQERKYRNLSEIEGLKATDMALYLQKLESLEYGTDGSIKMMLTEEQMTLFLKDHLDRRKAKAAFQQKMKKEGVSAQDIQAKYWEERLADF